MTHHWPDSFVEDIGNSRIQGRLPQSEPTDVRIEASRPNCHTFVAFLRLPVGFAIPQINPLQRKTCITQIGIYVLS
jgi:hypothetical protein